MPAARFALLGDQTGNCLRVSVMLEILGLDYQSVPVRLRQGEHREPAFLQTNPFGRVPVLIDRQPGPPGEPPFVLTQSNAILLYLADLAPDALLPAAPGPRRAKALERYLYFVTDVIAPGGASFALMQQRFTHGGDFLMRRALRAIAAAEIFLSEDPYLAGPDLTLADVAAVTVIHAYRDRIDWRDLPKLRGWFERMTARDDVQRGLAAFDAH
jgi:Glutathione S-transferase